ncbi:MAG: NAD(P)H-hydrate dehydratase [Actinomycetia bacterium]|nr:NAD(P)H-hydrate dehydratase [Actinomycetes bacterium]
MQLPPIPADAHKYSRGSLLILAGSRRFPGSAVLAARAAARSGAGYVSLAVPASVTPIAQSHLLTVPVLAAAEDQGAFAAGALAPLLAELRPPDAILCGPGLTITAGTQALLADLLCQAPAPLVLDADAINLLGYPDADGQPLWQHLPAETILTPHSGELSRLLATVAGEGRTIPAGQPVADPSTFAELAGRLQVVLVVKGPQTIVYAPTATIRPYLVTPATAAVAKAGSGDVLAGILAALLAQGASAWEAATNGMELAVAAGRLAEMNGSRRSLIASDIIEALSPAIRQIEGV